MTAESGTERSMAELEAEARERARKTMQVEEPKQNTSPGQPEVTRFRKTSSHRPLIVCLLSLFVLVALAFCGDRIFVLLKRGSDAEAESVPPPSGGTLKQERKDLGMDSNPFGPIGPEKPEVIADNHQTIIAPSPTLNKAVALADNSHSTSAPEHAPVSQNEQQNRAPQTEPQTNPTEANTGVAKVTGVRRLGLDADFYLPVDRYIPCSMMQRFVSDVGGHISCLVSEDVYSASGHVKLLPAGTVARGVYRTGALQHGRGRLFVIWTELRTPEPNSLQIPLTDTQATGPLGEAGIAGWIDTHFRERFGNALILSTVQDVAAAASDSAPGTDRNTDYTENTRAATAEMAKAALENSIDIPPTMYLNQGDVIGILTGTDIDFSSVWQLRLKKRWYEH
ncbi:VirB10/TraB/TrbI family type IV secretion system protein [Vagococcus sp. WN89Y]|uniref:VirB10/TraB/TrbI family type IV secretion system protein n=1 Tax=Vagococcus sp. WN89Y TaxID=3457258 RepID=UPI003FCCF7F9